MLEFDKQWACHRIPVASQEIPKTAFVTRSENDYIFKRSPPGIAIAPWIFSRLVDTRLSPFGTYSGLLTYVTDLILCSNTWAHHKQLLEGTFHALIKARLELRPSKTQLIPDRVKCLGYKISREGTQVGKDRIQAIVDK